MGLSKNIIRLAKDYIKDMTSRGFTDDEIIGYLKEELSELEDRKGHPISEYRLDRICCRIYDEALTELYLEGCI